MPTRWGFTTVFDVASILDNTNVIRTRIASGEVLGPRILTTGEPFFPVHGVPSYVSKYLDENSIVLPDDLTTAVAVERVRRAQAIVQEAHRLHRPVFAHPSNLAGVDIALSSGVDVLAHVTSDEEMWPPALVERMRAAHMALIPTLTLFEVEAKKGNVPANIAQKFVDSTVAFGSARLLPAAPPKAVFVTARYSILSSIDHIKRQQRAIVGRYRKSNNAKGLTQALTTLVPLALLWWAAVLGVGVSLWLTLAAMLLITLFDVRVFALMHECGHGSLFRSPWFNRATGFLLGVVSGMPQYVWSQHHSYHHAHNGNWDKYRGPYTTLSVDEYAVMTNAQQRMYRYKCSIAAAPVAGFIYLIFNPRFTWLKGSIGLVSHIIRNKVAQPTVSLSAHAASFKTRYWKSTKEYRHMFWNNVVLLSGWGVMCWACGTALFFTIYLITLSIAGGVGIILFTVQHNFEHSYASENKCWDYTTGAIKGTSFLILPRWINWLTINMAYHHIHHLSANIPNYSLVKCHIESQHLFSDVTRVKLSQIPNALKYILWDTHAQRIISVLEYRQQLAKRAE